jgi:hypothetical protein
VLTATISFALEFEAIPAWMPAVFRQTDRSKNQSKGCKKGEK